MLYLVIYIVGFLFFAYLLGTEVCACAESEERILGLVVSTSVALLWPLLLIVMSVVALQLRIHSNKIERVFDDD